MVLALSGRGEAQTKKTPPPAGKPDYDKAREHYTKGTAALQARDFSSAAREFGAAYQITKDPVLFFKIAQAHDNASDCESALVYYGRYLKEANPSKEDQAVAEQRVMACTKKMGSAEQSGRTEQGVDRGVQTDFGSDTGDSGSGDDLLPSPTETHVDGAATQSTAGPLTDGEPSWQHTAAWVSVGVTVGAATVAAVLGLSAASREEDIDRLVTPGSGGALTFEGSVREQYEAYINEGKDQQTYSFIAWGVAGAAAVAATVFFVLDASAGREKATGDGLSLVPMISSEAVGLSAGWGF
jgi:hypothetical protein